MTNSEIHVSRSEKIILDHGSLQSIVVLVKDSLDLEIVLPEKTSGSCYVRFNGNGKLQMTVNAHMDTNWSFLIVNESEDSIEFEENWRLNKNAQLQIAVGELTSGNHIKSVNYHLLEEGSSLYVRGANLVQSKLEATLKAIHYKGNTTAQIDNYGIVLQECEYTLDVIGKIEKAAKNAKTHQISRVMNFGLKPKTSVNPKLIIDENDVEASHAASMGQPDILQVHYLQSRGLSRSESLKLISLGYLLPIVDVIEDEIVKEKLKEAVIEKINNSSLM